MSSDENRPDTAVFNTGGPATYTLEIIAEITGISSRTILLYQEQGLVRPPGPSGEFDDEAIHTLRRIEHLRQTCEANTAGLKLILDLLEQVETLRSQLRARL